MNLEDFTTKKKLKSKVEGGDLYLRGSSVYRVSLYNETDDKVILETTNDELSEISSWTKRVDLRHLGFVECPLALRGPAFDVFDLRDKPTPESVEALTKYRKDNEWVYEKFDVEKFFDPNLEVRSFRVPDGLAAATEYRLIEGQLIKVAFLFYALTKEEAKQHYKQTKSDEITYNYAMKYQSWPIIYINKRWVKQ